MPGYKNYILTGGKIPKTTLWCQKKRKAKKLEEMKLTRLEDEACHKKKMLDQSIQAGCSGTNEMSKEWNISGCSTSINTSGIIITDSADTSMHFAVTDNDTNKQEDECNLSDVSAGSPVHELSSELPGSASASSTAGDSDKEQSFFERDSMLNHTHEEISYNEMLHEEIDAADDEADTDSLNNKSFITNGTSSEKICQCSDTTVGDVIFMTVNLGFKHNLSWEAQADILQMIQSMHDNQALPATKYLYLKALNAKDKNISYHITCNNCENYLGTKADVGENCQHCNERVDLSNPQNIFVSVPIEDQMKTFFENEEFANSILTYRFKKRNLNSETLKDIYDGAQYKRLFENGNILSEPFNFSYSFFTDGIPLGKASNKTIWPIYVTLNDIPYEDRMKYIMLAGLYVGPKDPNQEQFLKPFVEAANMLSSEGFTVVHKTQTVRCKMIPLCAIADSVARYQLLNFKSFAAVYGCTFCYKQSTRTRRGQRYTISEEPEEDRTAESTQSDLIEAFKKRNATKTNERHHRGVKGPTPLMNLMYFSLISGFVVDYMHCVLLGVIKTHTQLLLESTRRNFWTCLGGNFVGIEHVIAAIDERLLSIKPPTLITRTPRSVKDMALWKASEWLSWLLFYAIPVLTGLLKEKYLVHLTLLSEATALLLQRSVTKDQVAEAHRLYLQYTYFFEKYFGPECMVYNVHLLSHIAQGVNNWGPLWTHNSFMYEAQNRHILQICQSPSNILLSITRKFLIYSSIPSMCSSFVLSERTIKFCENLTRRNLKKFVRSEEGCILLGKGQPVSDLSVDEAQTITTQCNVSPSDCLSFRRMILGNERFSTIHCINGKKKNDDSHCLTVDEKYISIRRIMKSPSENVILLVEVLDVESNRNLSHVHKIRKLSTVNNTLQCISPNMIKSHAVLTVIKDDHYLCSVPFGCFGN